MSTISSAFDLFSVTSCQGLRQAKKAFTQSNIILSSFILSGTLNIKHATWNIYKQVLIKCTFNYSIEEEKSGVCMSCGHGSLFLCCVSCLELSRQDFKATAMGNLLANELGWKEFISPSNSGKKSYLLNNSIWQFSSKNCDVWKWHTLLTMAIFPYGNFSIHPHNLCRYFAPIPFIKVTSCLQTRKPAAGWGWK